MCTNCSKKVMKVQTQINNSAIRTQQYQGYEKASQKIQNPRKGVFQVPDLKIESPKIYKAKKFACRSLKGRGVQSGIRVIYAYFEEQDRIELIEIYYKGDKENEDRERILKHYAC